MLSASLLLAGCANQVIDVDTKYAFIDFTSKLHGDPPSVLDSGEPVDYVLENMEGRKPQVIEGKLVHGILPKSGDLNNFANYYQARLDGECRAYGTSFTVAARDGAESEGFATLAAWAGTYEASGPVPKTPGHITISTTAGTWQWWVSDGGGERAEHLKVVKSGTFTAPASDGRTVWEASVFVDPGAGVGYLSLPGNDTTTGSRYVTLTDGEIGAALAAVDLPATTFAETVADSHVLMVEHYANRGSGDTARYPEFLSMWGYSLRLIEGR